MTATTITKLAHERETSKSNIHHIFSLFDPDLRPKAIYETERRTKAMSSKSFATGENGKTPITFKRLGAKLTVLAALSRPSPPTKPLVQ